MSNFQYLVKSEFTHDSYGADFELVTEQAGLSNSVKELPALERHQPGP
jgi:hypothetical protein